MKTTLWISFLLIGLFAAGCASLKEAQKAQSNGRWKEAEKIWQKWADAGYGDYRLKIVEMKQNSKNNDINLVKEAKKAYQDGSLDAALWLERYYYMHKQNTKALGWMLKADISRSKPFMFQIHLALLPLLKDMKKRQAILSRLVDIAYARKDRAAYELGRYYEKNDPHKAISFYRSAWKHGYVLAGLRLGEILLKTPQNQKEGLAILKKIAAMGNGRAAYDIGEYYRKKMYQRLNKMNRPCVSLTFQTPKEFFEKKFMMLRFKQTFMHQNVLPWYLMAVKNGYLKARIKLLDLDLKEDNFKRFSKKDRYAGMDVEEAANWLENLNKNSKSFYPKLVLARLYEDYPILGKTRRAETIYDAYMDVNKTDALWHLYLYAKKYAPKRALRYLQPLLARKYTPAVVESLYKNYKISRKPAILDHLKHYAKKNDTQALIDLVSLYLEGAIPKTSSTVWLWLERLCKTSLPLNGDIDKKIAVSYLNLKTPPQIIKAAAIYKFYADLNDTKAQFALAKLLKKYGKLYQAEKLIVKAKTLGDDRAREAFARMVLSGEIHGDVHEALKIIEQKISTDPTPEDLIWLADMYAGTSPILCDFEKAKTYYFRALKMKAWRAYLGLGDLYAKQVGKKAEETAEEYYKLAIRHGYNLAWLRLGGLYMRLHRYHQAKKALSYVDAEKYPEVYRQLYTISGDGIYIQEALEHGQAWAFYQKALQLEQKNPKKSLRYALEAARCGVSGATYLLYNLFNAIADHRKIESIVDRARDLSCNNVVQGKQ